MLKPRQCYCRGFILNFLSCAMKLKVTLLFLASLAALGGCSSPDSYTEPLAHSTPEEVAAFLGENITYGKGRHTLSNDEGPKGTYLEITVHDDKLAAEYDDLGLPASNCAYLSYKNMPAAERQQYDYLKITMQGGLASPSFVFLKPELAQATQAAADLDTLMTFFKERNYQAVVNTFHPSALTPTARTQLPVNLAAIEQKFGPVQQYYLEGYAPMPQADKKNALIRLFVMLNHPQKASRALIVINPRMHPKENFLYELNMFN